MVTPKGVRSYIFQYRLGGRSGVTKRVTIGKHGAVTAEQARRLAEALLSETIKGVDPVAAERASKAAQQAEREAAQKAAEDAKRLAFDTYAALFVERHAKARGLRSATEIEAVLTRDLVPHFGSTPLPAIRRMDIRAALDKIEDRSASAANKGHKWLRKLFLWAVNRGDIEASPMTAMTAPAPDGKRTRVLSDSELAAVWVASGDLGWPFSQITRLLILTGQRLREVAGMTWAEIDLAKGEWIIPAARSKNKRAHLVPLSNAVLSILNDERARGLNFDLLFTTTGHSPPSGFSKAKARLDALLVKAEAKAAEAEGREPAPSIPAWVMHDLRRTAATGMQGLGVPLEHSEKVLNHVSGKHDGIAGIYHLYEFYAEKRAALDAWAAHVMHIIGEAPTASNVLPIARARKAKK